MKAPTGSEIQGTSEMIPGAASVVFTDEDPGYDHDGNGTEMFWDGSLTQTVAGASMFTDEDGTDWMQHHLIPDDALPLTDDTIAAFGKEESVGVLLDSLKRTSAAAKDAGVLLLLTRNAIEDTQRLYDELKKLSLSKRDRDLAAQAATVQA